MRVELVAQSTPSVSVVVPSFNRAHLLPRALRSVAAQTFSDWEVIVVDDGSTDKTFQVCSQLGERFGGKLRYFHQLNAGASAARNFGLSQARGEFVAFLDSDDLFTPLKIELQVAAMRDKGAKFSFTGYFMFDDRGKVSSVNAQLPQELDDFAYPSVLSTKFNVVFTPSVIVDRRIAIELGGFEKSMAVCEDLDLWGRICRGVRTVAVRRPLVGIHVRTEPVFPYEAGLAGRLHLYRRALSQDAAVRPVADSSIKLLFEIFIGTAHARGDSRIAALLESRLNEAGLSGDYLLSLERAVDAVQDSLR